MAARFSILILLAGCASSPDPQSPEVHCRYRTAAGCDSPPDAVMVLSRTNRRFLIRDYRDWPGYILTSPARIFTLDDAKEALADRPGFRRWLSVELGAFQWQVDSSAVSCDGPDARELVDHALPLLVQMGADPPTWLFEVRTCDSRLPALVDFLRKRGVHQVKCAIGEKPLDLSRPPREFTAEIGASRISGSLDQRGQLLVSIGSTDAQEWLELTEDFETRFFRN